MALAVKFRSTEMDGSQPHAGVHRPRHPPSRAFPVQGIRPVGPGAARISLSTGDLEIFLAVPNSQSVPCELFAASIIAASFNPA